MNINYNSIAKNSILIVYVISLAYVISSMLYIYLPKQAPAFIIKEDNALEYKRYDVRTAFKQKKIERKIVKKQVVKKHEYKFLSNMVLNAIYDMGKSNGIIIIREKGKAKTYILALKENFKGYKLDRIFAKYVIFKKNNKEYKLSMIKDDEVIKYEQIQEVTKIEKNIDIQNDKVSIKRDLIDDYIQNFDKIWNDISINEVRTKNGIDGFKISRVKNKSVFMKLGLKKGDIIKSVNNIKLKSYNDAFKLYKKINKIKVINMVILRDNIEQELIYEIK